MHTSAPPCSTQAQTTGVDPVGTAGTYDEYYLLETPLPWLSDIWASKHVPTGVKDMFDKWSRSERMFRAMAIVPNPKYSVEGKRVLIHYKIEKNNRLFFERAMYRIPESALETSLESVFNGNTASLEQFEPEYDLEREFFVCTHGSRDQCCGTKGFPIFQTLEKKGYAVWRVSHTGGHRFAPTAIDFPTGHYWAWLNDEAIDAIVHHHGHPEMLKQYYRGHSNIGAKEQVIERELFLRKGWEAWKDERIIRQEADELTFQVQTDLKTYRVQLEALPPIVARAKCSTEETKPYAQYRVIKFDEHT